MARESGRSPAEHAESLESMRSMALAAAMAEESRQPMKVAWIAALALHFLLFLVVFPDFGSGDLLAEQRDTVVIQRYKPPEPPKQQPEKKVVKKNVARVPIPDPTPDDPEPIVDDNVEYIETDEDRPDTEFFAGGPVGGPPVIDTGPMRVGNGVQAPQRLVYIAPEYPELARRARMGGTVVLEATIDRDGNVVNVSVVEGLGLGIDESAVTAVSQWRYTPTFYRGRPVELLLTVRLKYNVPR